MSKSFINPSLKCAVLETVPCSEGHIPSCSEGHFLTKFRIDAEGHMLFSKKTLNDVGKNVCLLLDLFINKFHESAI